MRIFIFLFILFLASQVLGQNKTLYDFSAETITGETFDFSTLKGKKVLIVNTASECMLTPQFKKLQELYEEYGGDDFEIIGFPCNDFGKQDPAGNDVIYDFCTKKYGVTFPMMAKIEIEGENVAPIYKWLTSSEENGVLDANVTWNFQKFLINKNGEVIDFVSPFKGPKSNRIIEWLNEEE
ncbi:glutathione peroxidase [Prolixibacteraceae bacterium Z1-6]|uniref:Glutathione peroxidase n=1 Tax=Draconibacterium aestuarii TaxID=2998507 RepID=A0A9X3J551_9BACT|nr:glutathione peroxidase [Prolixibacteraceae bacterium Z1-6]